MKSKVIIFILLFSGLALVGHAQNLETAEDSIKKVINDVEINMDNFALYMRLANMKNGRSCGYTARKLCIPGPTIKVFTNVKDGRQFTPP